VDKFEVKSAMDQRPAMSQSPLRMHNQKNNKSSNNYSQKQLGSLPSQTPANRGSNFGASPMRESLIKNTGAFILGNASKEAVVGSPVACLVTH